MKILLMDVETTPYVSYTWGMWEQNVIEAVENSHMLCFAYKWLGEKTTHVVSLRQFPRYKKDPKNDIEVIKALHKLFDEADVVVAHNGNKFDIKYAQARFIVHNLPSPSPFKKIDTYLVARATGKFRSNSLDSLGEELGLGRKVKHEGFPMWKGCMAGDEKAWAMMEKYNKQDVVLLEQVYLRLRGYMPNHPKSFSGHKCEVCDSDSVQNRGQYRKKGGKVMRRYSCNECGTWGSYQIT